MSAGDFYFAINATFRFIEERFGSEALDQYWRTLARDYYAPVTARFRSGGLSEVETYWREFFREEPGGEVQVRQVEGRVELEVKTCPALDWLRKHDRQPITRFCSHCEVVSGEIAQQAGMQFHLEGGGGSCLQTFTNGGSQ